MPRERWYYENPVGKVSNLSIFRKREAVAKIIKGRVSSLSKFLEDEAIEKIIGAEK